MNTKTNILAIGLLTLINLASAGAASAASLSEFSGSRADVRAFCSIDGYHLLEGGTYSLCVTETSDVMCTDAGICTSSNLEISEADLNRGFAWAEIAEASGNDKS